MCSVTAALIGAQMGMQMMAQHQQTKAQVAAYNNQAKQAEQNAKISEARQNQIAEAYAKKQQELNSRMRLIAGRNASQAGASGMTFAGSALDLTRASGDQYEEDSRTLLGNQRNDVRSEYMNQVNLQNAASQYRAAAKNAKAQGRMAMFSTVLGAASSMYNLHQQQGSASVKNTDSGNSGGSGNTSDTGNLFSYTPQGIGVGGFSPNYANNLLSVGRTDLSSNRLNLWNQDSPFIQPVWRLGKL